MATYSLKLSIENCGQTVMTLQGHPKSSILMLFKS